MMEPLCTCGQRGYDHDRGPACPQEGTLLPESLFQVFDDRVLRIRYDDDPVALALIDAHAQALHDLRWVHAFRVQDRDAFEAAMRLSKVDGETIARQGKELQDVRRDLAIAVRRAEELEHDVETVRREAETQRLRWRAIVEEVAIRAGLVRPHQDWTPGSMLREMNVRMERNDG